MAETKQISATVSMQVAEDVIKESEKENRSFSGMVETLLMEALDERSNKKVRALKRDRSK